MLKGKEVEGDGLGRSPSSASIYIIYQLNTVSEEFRTFPTPSCVGRESAVLIDLPAAVCSETPHNSGLEMKVKFRVVWVWGEATAAPGLKVFEGLLQPNQHHPHYLSSLARFIVCWFWPSPPTHANIVPSGIRMSHNNIWKIKPVSLSKAQPNLMGKFAGH